MLLILRRAFFRHGNLLLRALNRAFRQGVPLLQYLPQSSMYNKTVLCPEGNTAQRTRSLARVLIVPRFGYFFGAASNRPWTEKVNPWVLRRRLTAGKCAPQCLRPVEAGECTRSARPAMQ